MQPIKVVAFDVDGMLLTGQRFSDRYSAEFGIPVEEMAPFFEGPYQPCVIGKANLKTELQKGWLERWKWHGTVDELLGYWFASGAERNEPVLATVESLRANGIICVITTNQEKFRADFLHRLFTRDGFNAFFASADLGCKKPDTRFFQSMMKVLQKLNPSILPADVLFWDDRQSYADGAEKFGLQARLFTNTDSYLREMEKLGLLIPSLN